MHCENILSNGFAQNNENSNTAFFADLNMKKKWKILIASDRTCFWLKKVIRFFFSILNFFQVTAPDYIEVRFLKKKKKIKFVHKTTHVHLKKKLLCFDFIS